MQIKSDVEENWATKIVKHWIKNISSNIGAVIIKLGTKRESQASGLKWDCQ